MIYNGLLSLRGVGRDRTADTRIFSPLLYRLSYRTLRAANIGFPAEPNFHIRTKILCA